MFSSSNTRGPIPALWPCASSSPPPCPCAVPGEARIVRREADKAPLVFGDHSQFGGQLRQTPLCMIVRGFTQHQRQFVRQGQVRGFSKDILGECQHQLVDGKRDRLQPAPDMDRKSFSSEMTSSSSPSYATSSSLSLPPSPLGRRCKAKSDRVSPRANTRPGLSNPPHSRPSSATCSYRGSRLRAFFDLAPIPPPDLIRLRQLRRGLRVRQIGNRLLNAGPRPTCWMYCSEIPRIDILVFERVDHSHARGFRGTSTATVESPFFGSHLLNESTTAWSLPQA